MWLREVFFLFELEWMGMKWKNDLSWQSSTIKIQFEIRLKGNRKTVIRLEQIFRFYFKQISMKLKSPEVKSQVFFRTKASLASRSIRINFCLCTFFFLLVLLESNIIALKVKKPRLGIVLTVQFDEERTRRRRNVRRLSVHIYIKLTGNVLSFLYCFGIPMAKERAILTILPAPSSTLSLRLLCAI